MFPCTPKLALGPPQRLLQSLSADTLCRTMKSQLTPRCQQEVFRTQVEVRVVAPPLSIAPGRHSAATADQMHMFVHPLECDYGLHTQLSPDGICHQAAADYRTDTQLAQYCQGDADKLCSDVTPGEGRVQECLVRSILAAIGSLLWRTMHHLHLAHTAVGAVGAWSADGNWSADNKLQLNPSSMPARPKSPLRSCWDTTNDAAGAVCRGRTRGRCPSIASRSCSARTWKMRTTSGCRCSCCACARARCRSSAPMWNPVGCVPLATSVLQASCCSVVSRVLVHVKET